MHKLVTGANYSSGTPLTKAVERLALGEAYTDQGYVVCNEAGEPYHPSTLSTLWQAAIRGLDVPQIRLHDARHTCATLVHLQGVPIALVAGWLGHADVSFTLRTYVHAQTRGARTRGTQLCSPGRQQRGLMLSHTRAVTSTRFL